MHAAAIMLAVLPLVVVEATWMAGLKNAAAKSKSRTAKALQTDCMTDSASLMKIGTCVTKQEPDCTGGCAWCGPSVPMCMPNDVVCTYTQGAQSIALNNGCPSGGGGAPPPLAPACTAEASTHGGCAIPAACICATGEGTAFRTASDARDVTKEACEAGSANTVGRPASGEAAAAEAYCAAEIAFMEAQAVCDAATPLPLIPAACNSYITCYGASAHDMTQCTAEMTSELNSGGASLMVDGAPSCTPAAMCAADKKRHDADTALHAAAPRSSPASKQAACASLMSLAAAAAVAGAAFAL